MSTPSSDKQPSPSPSPDSATIYTMPDKYRGEGAKSAGGKKPTGKLTLIIGLGVLLLFVVAAVIVYISTGMDRQPQVVTNTNTPTNTNQVVTPVNEVVVNAPLNVTPIPEVVEETPTEAVPVVSVITPVPSSLDTDGDGLTNIEESIYTTSATSADTDTDAYSDGLEVLNLYNPAGIAPVRLEDSGLVSVYRNASIGYRVLYPKSWVARSFDATQEEVLFTADTGEFIQVIAGENPDGKTAMEWYAEQVPEMDVSQLEKIDTGVFEGVKSQNGLVAYVTPKTGERNILYIVAYNIGTRTEGNFPITFDMMIRSLIALAP